MQSRFVAPRASRAALIVASVPLETKRIFSMKGIARVISVASSSSSSVVTPKLVPRRAWSAIASLIAGFACPTIMAPQEHTKSSSSFPSASYRFCPLPPSMTSPSPPTTPTHPPDNMQVRQRGLNHNHIRALFEIKLHFFQSFPRIGGIHLITAPVAKLGSGLSRFPERSVEAGAVFRGIRKNGNVLELMFIQRFTNGPHAPVHHV